MSKANFMNCMAPTNLHSTNLQSNDQAAMAIRQRRRDESRKTEMQNAMDNIGVGGLMSRPLDGMLYWRRREQENKILARQDKQGERGGMTMRPEAAFTNPQPPTFRDK